MASPLLALAPARAVLPLVAARLEHSRCTFCSTCGAAAASQLCMCDVVIDSTTGMPGQSQLKMLMLMLMLMQCLKRFNNHPGSCKLHGNTADTLLILLESRLDVILYRAPVFKY